MTHIKRDKLQNKNKLDYYKVKRAQSLVNRVKWTFTLRLKWPNH